jgi:essential nuclear protein 1
MFNKFMPHEEDPIFHPKDPSSAGPTNLADLILEKIAEHEAKQAGEGPYGPYIQGGGIPEDAVQIPAKAVEVYEKYVLRQFLVRSS